MSFSEVVGQVGDDPHADNLLFTGDSLDVLRILCEVPEYRALYRGKVKLIYIDPPFNTGQTFEHYDDWMEHSTWLSFMRERLLLIRELLSSEGSVWVHLDDVEVHRMRCVLDEVFGAGNFIEDLAVELNPKGRQLGRWFAGSLDRILVYAKDARVASLVAASTEEVSDSDFPLSDDRGAYRLLPLRNTNKKFNPVTRPNLAYPLQVHPQTLEVRTEQFEGSVAVLPVFGDLTRAVWRWGKPKTTNQHQELIGRWVNGRSGRRLDVFQKDYNESGRTKKYRDFWASSEVGSSDRGKAEIKKILPGSVFDTPKPESLMARIVGIATVPGDVVVDCFAGSGTTAAVAQKMGRRWVSAEISPSTVEEFTLPRLIKVIEGHDEGGVTASTGWQGGGGFRHVTVGPSMYDETPYGVVLAEWATNGRFARAVAGQLGFQWQAAAPPLCGIRGRMRLAVVDGAVGVEEVRQIVGSLGERERVTIVAKAVLPVAEAELARLSAGSRIRKAPRDLLTAGARRMRRRTDAAPTDAVEGAGS
ncbi:DNA methyltransferase [Allobranchiibius huperziae]|uniref:Adenine-specific DNA-methyltransferase n=1 Tax=Allobranchiibius huperziae TaxID=1874116 RepID=A0A853DG24_9MICO|nr:adenine-specific DNA-methyltransferase [Allobranchiibius huperziae]